MTAIEPKWLVEVAPQFFKVADANKISKRKRQEKIEPLYNKYEKPDEWRLSKVKRSARSVCTNSALIQKRFLTRVNAEPNIWLMLWWSARWSEVVACILYPEIYVMLFATLHTISGSLRLRFALQGSSKCGRRLPVAIHSGCTHDEHGGMWRRRLYRMEVLVLPHRRWRIRLFKGTCTCCIRRSQEVCLKARVVSIRSVA